MTEYKSKKDVGLNINKDIRFTKIKGIHIDSFRKFKNQDVKLGSTMTVICGKNGTLKSSVLGLISHIYRTDQEDIFNNKIQTELKDVFKLSLKKDVDTYKYYIQFTAKSPTDNNKEEVKIQEPISIYLNSEKTRHRIVPSGSQKGDGFFNLPSRYINLKRLFPLIDSEVNENSNASVTYTEDEKKFIGRIYEKTFLKSEFKSSSAYTSNVGKHSKQSFAPDFEEAKYDIDSISSGEDNLSAFINIMISFMRIHEKLPEEKNKDLLGIISIDEFEASLHPVAQINLFNFLKDWASKHNVQIILNTHSLFLIQEILKNETDISKGYVSLNLITDLYANEGTLLIKQNPTYNDFIEDLTLRNETDQEEQIFKIDLFCEDEVAQDYITKIIKKKDILKHLNFISSLSDEKKGNSYSDLQNLIKKYPVLLKKNPSIIVLDADISLDDKLTKKFDYFNKIPSDMNLPLEKEIVNYILNLDGGDLFFLKQKKSKEAFKQEFNNHNIPLKPDDITKVKTNLYKNWSNSNKSKFKTYVTYFVKQNPDIFKEFEKKIKEDMNKIFKTNNIPIEL